MKILNITMNNKPSFTKAFNKAFECDVFHYAELISRTGKTYTNERLLARVDAFQPDIVFMEFHDYGSITDKTLEIIKNKGILIIAWTGDVFANGTQDWYYDLAKYAICCFSNMNDVNNLKANGFESYFFNHYEEDLYIPMGLHKTTDVIYIGSKYDRFPLSVFRNEMVDLFSKNYNFKVYGDNWLGQYGARVCSREESVKLYNESKIAISISNVDSEDYTSDRLFHALSSGTFTLCKHFEGADKYFTNMQHLVYFTNFENLRQLIDYYLSHDEEREQIAKQGRERCVEQFGNAALLNKISEIYTQHQTNKFNENSR